MTYRITEAGLLPRRSWNRGVVTRTRHHRHSRTTAHIARFDRHCRVIEMSSSPNYRLYIQRRTRDSRRWS